MAIETQGTNFGVKTDTETVSVTFDAGDNTVIRASGSFATKFAVGDVITTDLADNPGPFEVLAINQAGTEMTLSGVVDGYASPDSTVFTIYTPVGQVTNFDGPGGEASVIDASHLKSTAKEKLMGLPDEGQFSFGLNFVPGNPGQIECRAARKDRNVRDFILMFSNDTATVNADWATFQGFVLGFTVSGAVDDKVNASATIEITGEVTWSDE